MADRVPFSRLVLAKSGAFSSADYLNTPSIPEEILWRAVIDRALHDLGNENKTIREEAEEWFDVLNEDFVEICRLANVFPKEVFDFIENNGKVLLESSELEDYIIDITIYLKIRKRKSIWQLIASTPSKIM